MSIETAELWLGRAKRHLRNAKARHDQGDQPNTRAELNAAEDAASELERQLALAQVDNDRVRQALQILKEY